MALTLSTKLARKSGLFSFSKQKKLLGLTSQRLKPSQKRLNSSSGNFDAVIIQYSHGFPVISLKLPSLNERCSFTMHPITSTVGQFLEDLKAEDRSIDTAVIHGHDDARIASSTKIDHLLLDRFKLTINHVTYEVDPPRREEIAVGDVLLSNAIKHQVAILHKTLSIDQHHAQTKQEAIEKLKLLKQQLEPLEKVKQDLESKANFRTNLVVWGGLAYMGAQFGILARLTWWEYSWDIMEPVTYFITYGSAILMYGYYILTKQEYIYPDARDRQYLRFLHKAARKSDFDVTSYNSLCSQIVQAEEELTRLGETVESSPEDLKA